MSEIKSKEIKLVDIDAIVFNPKNANKHSDEQIDRLATIIKYQGFRNPVIISNRTGFLVSGHGRVMAARKEGLTQVPAIYQDFENEAQEYSYLISDNEIARWSELDKDLVFEEIKEIDDIEIDLLGLQDFKFFDYEEDEKESTPLEEKPKEYKIEVKFPNELEMRDYIDELQSKGFIVKVFGE